MSVEISPNSTVAGTTYTVTATVLGSGDVPVAGATVTWTASPIYGPNWGQPVLTPTNTLTDSNGQATTTVRSTNVGTSTITATATDSTDSQSGGAQATWNCPVQAASRAGFYAYSPGFVGGVFLATGDIDEDGCAEVITGADAGGGPHVKILRPNGSPINEFMAYDENFAGGVRVATGDVNGDGIADIVTGAGPGGGPHVRVFSGEDLSPIRSFMAYDQSFSGGIFVAAGDLNQDGYADIVTGADAGGGPHVRVFSGADLSPIHSFYAYDSAFPGGVRVAAGDVDNDGTDDIITGAGPGGGSHVRAFSGTDLSPLTSFMAYQSFSGGVFVASGDENADGHAEIITGAGPGGGPHVRSFSGASLSTVLTEFMAYNQLFRGGVRVAAGDMNGDGYAELLTASGPGGGPHVRLFDTNAPSWEGTFWTGLKLRVSMDKAMYRLGETASLELIIENTTDETLVVVESGCGFQTWFQNEGGEKVGPSLGCISVVTPPYRYQPYQQRILQLEWEQLNSPGTYYGFGSVDGWLCPEVAGVENPSYEDYKSCIREDRSLSDHVTGPVPFRVE